jgi:hypothetical protein
MNVTFTILPNQTITMQGGKTVYSIPNSYSVYVQVGEQEPCLVGSNLAVSQASELVEELEEYYSGRDVNRGA